jgi:hypothetical protein
MDIISVLMMKLTSLKKELAVGRKIDQGLQYTPST